MKRALLGFTILGFVTAPAFAHNGFHYVDSNNDISMLVVGNEDIPQNEELDATGGLIDPKVQTGTIRICDGVGGAIADVLLISTDALGRVTIQLVTDPKITGKCHSPLAKTEINDALCPGNDCVVTSFFPGAKDVEVVFR